MSQKSLPVPQDDGVANPADHLLAKYLSRQFLPGTDGRSYALADLAGFATLYIYPMTSRPDRPLPDDWDDIPGARGCTPQSCSFRDHYGDLQALGSQVFGISTQTTEYQFEAKTRLHLPFELLSDAGLQLKQSLSLPTFHVAGRELYKRITLIVKDGRIVKVFYPVFPPTQNATDVLAWFERKPRIEALIAKLAIDHHAKAAYRQLLSKGLEILPFILEGLKHDNAQLRYYCCSLLDHLLIPEALTDLIGAVDDPDPKVRTMALHALACERCKEGDCRPAEADILPKALHILHEDIDAHVRAMAIEVVGQYAHSNETAVCALNAAHKGDRSPTVRKKAGWYAPGGPIYQRITARHKRAKRGKLTL